MEQNATNISSGDTYPKDLLKVTTGKMVSLLGETFYQIQNYDVIPPFFMSLVSSYDHWLFISSSGGLSAGRGSAEQALFPYFTEDKLNENSENTGSKTILQVRRCNQSWLWEPFSTRQQGQYHIERKLYKNIPGTALIFEEINHSIGLTFRYAWRTSDRFGFIKSSWLFNGNSTCEVELLDGIQNILPANATTQLQNNLSCLLDAYKRNELDPETGLGIFALNSTLTDLAEPSESLLATTVFQVGLENSNYLISSLQLDRFRTGMSVTPETEVRGRRGAYFVHARFELPPGKEAVWHVVADIHQDICAIKRTLHVLRGDPLTLSQEIELDIKSNTTRLNQIVTSADGWQLSAKPLRTSHHFANVMFNVMRGGIFADQYWIDKVDFIDFVSSHHQKIIQDNAEFFMVLPEKFRVSDLHARAAEQASADLVRLSYTYLPLTFSRRHGDPSRPWNRFAINIKKADGSQRLDYEGNWRDIFQNWEALAYAFPEYVEGMILTFLSATTADGYNPYRITRSGIDWEIPDASNPWANIGYWSDHQIIYLQKLMEISVKVHPGRLRAILQRPILSFANVPYRIKPYADLQKDPYNTIVFDHPLEHEIESLVMTRGADGRLVCDANGDVLHRSLAEKLLLLLLAKLVNFVPEGGIWMNTQRPEWNDANNALVGKGLSVVTLGYLRRYIAFCQNLFSQDTPAALQMSAEVVRLFEQIAAILELFQPRLADTFNDEQRRAMVDALGQAGSDYRWQHYSQGFSGEFIQLSRDHVLGFLELSKCYIEHSLRANRRSDHLYHTYNTLHLDGKRASINHLYEMLEGQVSILSSGLLSGDESLALLESLRSSALYRADQQTYILYPDKTLKGFLSKNDIPAEQVRDLRLPDALFEAQDKTLLVRDMDGIYHFSGQLRNAKDVRRVLEVLGGQERFSELVTAEGEKITILFEEVFRHNEFTGRSGTFFAYEGLGSIYWHMVAKLLVAVQEIALRVRNSPGDFTLSQALKAHYIEIQKGLGFNKSPAVYGAFPTDPYSHTPKGQGAKQPGMTGQVKEEILTRQAELGLLIQDGKLAFDPFLFSPEELLTASAVFSWFDVVGQAQSLEIPAGSLAYTFCQVPILLKGAGEAHIEVHRTDGLVESIPGSVLDSINSQHIFQRDGVIHHLSVSIGSQK